jgi:hypothetical protein
MAGRASSLRRFAPEVRAICAPLCDQLGAGALMTGKLCSNIGAWDNTAPLPSDVPTFAHHLTTDICPFGFQSGRSSVFHGGIVHASS